MNAPSPVPSPSSPREAELASAEAELAHQEARLAEQLSLAAVEAETLAHRFDELRKEISQVPAERRSDEHLLDASRRLGSTAVSTSSMKQARERALAVRREALEARRRASREAQEALNTLRQLTTRGQQELTEVESGLKRSAEEAAARAQREREEAQARQEAARARQAKSQENPTIPEPRPLGARATPRVRMQATVDLRSDSNFFTGFSTNISKGGIFVATIQTVPRGTTVDLDLTLPGGRPLRVTGVVRWAREANDKTPELMPGLGVQFTNLPPEVAEAISDFVTTREPLFFPD